MTVYTSPDQPGCPQVGDVVVVVSNTSGNEWTGRLVGPHFGYHGWSAFDGVKPWHGCPRIRRPTEAELAAWALDPVAAGELRPITGVP